MNIWGIVAEWAPVVIGLALPYVAGKLLPRLFPTFFKWIAQTLAPLFPALKMEPWLFEPIAEADLPADQRAFFQQHTPLLVMLGYQPLGDFVLRRDRKPSCSRYFLSRDGQSYAGLSCYLGTKSIEAVAVVLDGTYLETGSLALPRTPPQEHGLRFFSRVTSDPRELLEYHRACAERAAADLDSELALLEADDLPTVMNYGRRLALYSLNKEGMLPDLPDFLREQNQQEAQEERNEGYKLAAR